MTQFMYLINSKNIIKNNIYKNNDNSLSISYKYLEKYNQKYSLIIKINNIENIIIETYKSIVECFNKTNDINLIINMYNDFINIPNIKKIWCYDINACKLYVIIHKHYKYALLLLLLQQKKIKCDDLIKTIISFI